MADKLNSDDPRLGSFKKRYKWEPSWEFMDYYIRTQAGDKGTYHGTVTAIAAEIIHSWRVRMGGAVVAARYMAMAALNYDGEKDLPVILDLISWVNSPHAINPLDVIYTVYQECRYIRAGQNK